MSVNKMIYIFAHYIYIYMYTCLYICLYLFCYTFLYFFYSYMAYNMNNDNGCVSGAPWNILSCTLEIYIYCLYICAHFWHMFTHLYWRDANWRKQNGCLSFGVFFCVFCICRTCFWTFMCFFINKWGAPQVPLSNTHQFHIRKNLNIYIYIYIYNV